MLGVTAGCSGDGDDVAPVRQSALCEQWNRSDAAHLAEADNARDESATLAALLPEEYQDDAALFFYPAAGDPGPDASGDLAVEAGERLDRYRNSVCGEWEQCPGSVVRAIDGGHPLADALPPVHEARTDRSEAASLFDQDRPGLIDRYRPVAIELAPGFGRAWEGENGGEFEVVDVDDFGIVIRLETAASCPVDAALHVRSENWLPLFFFAPAG